MHTQTLPIQVSGASASHAPARASQNAGPAADGAQFSHALSREIEHRQQSPAPAAVPAKPAAPAQQQAAPAPNSQAAKAADADPADAPATDDARDDSADAAAATPVADMLALVASFNPPVQKAVSASADPLAAAASSAAEPAGAAALAAAMQASGDVAHEQPGLDGRRLAPALPAAGGPADAVRGRAFQAIAQGAVRARTPAASDDATVHAAAPASGKTGQEQAEPLVETRAAAPAAEPGAGRAPAAGAQVAQVRPHDIAAQPAALKEAPLAAPVLAPVAQASLAIAQAVVGAPADRIAARVGTPAWDNQVGQKIVWMVAGKEQSASLTLNPPDLGPLQVVLSVTNDQASVTFSSAQPEVRQALENAMPKLREMLGDTGIALGNATVDAGMPDQRQAQQGEQARGQGSNARFGATAGEAEPDARPAARPVRTAREGMVDTFA